MKDLPEIAPEIRGLLEEIVADPRSGLRFAPRHALRSWFERGETVRAREVSATKAERHLIEAHREALAALLCDAAVIAYWKAPTWAQRPIGPDGKPCSPAAREPSWRESARCRLINEADGTEGVQLLRRCLEGIAAEDAHELAIASLSLVPRNRTRCYCADTVPWSEPRTAIALFERLATQAQSAHLRPAIFLSLARRLCAVHSYGEAREAYRTSSSLDPSAPYGWFYCFNLSCFLGDERSAVHEAFEVGRLVGSDDPSLTEAVRVLKEWAATLPASEFGTYKRTVLSISPKISEGGSMLCKAIVS